MRGGPGHRHLVSELRRFVAGNGSLLALSFLVGAIAALVAWRATVHENAPPPMVMTRF